VRRTVFSSKCVKVAGNVGELLGNILVVSIQHHILQSVTCVKSPSTPAVSHKRPVSADNP
jgi:hypothetical protein